MPALKQILAPGAPRPASGCRICGLAFADGEEVAACDVDGAFHHPECWQWNGNRCGTPGCAGQGALVTPVAPPPPAPGAVSARLAALPPARVASLVHRLLRPAPPHPWALTVSMS